MNTNTYNNHEKGNVLFLILIAVALFAALSYAVTSSTRSGGSATKETNQLNAAAIVQTGSSLQTAVMRMSIGGVSASSLLFTPPSDFAANTSRYVYHPEGGSATYQEVAAKQMATGQPGKWVVNGQFNISAIGTSNADIIAFLPGIPLELCLLINNQNGLFAGAVTPGTPVAFASNVSATYNKSMADADTRGANGEGTITVDATIPASPTAFPADYAAKPSGCFQNGGGSGEYVYYTALIER
jgi:hypothetical protein